MAVYLAGSQPLGLCSPKAPTGCQAAGGVPSTQVDRFGGGASRAAGPDLGPGARWASLLALAAETFPARESLLLKRLGEVLYPGQRKNLLSSRSPESWSWEPETQAHDWGGAGAGGGATGPPARAALRTSRLPLSPILFGTHSLLAKRVLRHGCSPGSGAVLRGGR